VEGIFHRAVAEEDRRRIASLAIDDLSPQDVRELFSAVYAIEAVFHQGIELFQEAVEEIFHRGFQPI